MGQKRHSRQGMERVRTYKQLGIIVSLRGKMPDFLVSLSFTTGAQHANSCPLRIFGLRNFWSWEENERQESMALT